jgi:hypothetical protein
VAGWLIDYLGADGDLVVEVAWGADLTADPSGWSWTDITTDVYQDPGIATSMGKGDEAGTAQPGTCSMLLRNEAGAYSKGGESANWPYVRLGTPVRVRIDPDGSGYVVLFQGNATSWKPTWYAPTVPAVALEVAGTLRRLGTGQSPVESAFRRALRTDPHTVGYWPLEDGEMSAFGEPAVGTNRMVWRDTDDPNLASNSAFFGSGAIVTLANAELTSAVPYYGTGSGYVVCRMLVQFPESGEVNGELLNVYFQGGTVSRVVFTYNAATTSVDAAAYNTSGTLITLLGGTSFDLGVARRFTFEMWTSGSDVIVSWLSAPQFLRAGTFTDMTLTTHTIGHVKWVVINGGGLLNNVGVGHLAVLDGLTFNEWVRSEIDFVLGSGYFSAHNGEYANARIERLAEEHGELVEVIGESDMRMGPQSIGTLLALFQECEIADGGLLYDGTGPGLTYVCRTELESRAVDLTLDATADVVAPFEPADDDQSIRNKVTATRTHGVSATYEDEDGPLGTHVVGTYDTSETINHADDSQMEYYAQWSVHLGTVEGYRYPSIAIDPRRSPSLAPDILALNPGSRVDVTNLRTALTSHPGGTIGLLTHGIRHQLGSRVWVTGINCAPYLPWEVGTISPETDGTAISYQGDGAAATGAALYNLAGFNPDIPPDANPGDLLVLFATCRNSGTGTIVTPDDWTLLASSGNCSIFGRFMRPGEPEPTVVVSGAVVNETGLARIVAVRGVHPDIDDCVLDSAAQLNASAANIAYPALTIPDDNCIAMVFGWKADDWTNVATIAGMTEMFDSPTASGNDAGIVADYVIQTTAADISAGSFVVTGGAAAISRGITLALKPAVDPEFPQRLDTDGSTLASAVSLGATSMSVDTTAADTITYVGIGAIAAGSNASLAPALPATVAAGDLMLIVASIRNSGTGTVVAPSGWKSLLDFGNVSVLGRYNRTGDAAPTVTFAGGVANATTLAQCLAIRGAEKSLAHVVATSATQLNGSAQDIAYPARTISQDGCFVLVIGWKQDDWTSVAPIALEISDSPSALGDDAGHVLNYVIQTTATNISSGTLTVTGGGAAISRAIVIAFKPYTHNLWTTDSEDYPMDLSVGGVRFNATACSGSASPQTMTIDAAPVARDSGDAVELWYPPTPGR